MAQSKQVALLDLLVLAVCAFYIYIEELMEYLLPRSEKSLQGEIILVTGSASGLGKEICMQLKKSGAKLVLWDIAENENKKTAEALRNSGANFVMADTVDVADSIQVSVAATKVRHNVGNVTILVNNAGIAVMQQFLELTSTAVEETFKTNVLAHFWTLKEFLPYMLEKNSGHIITICSTMGQMAMRGPTPYYSTKHAVHGLIECLKDELAHLPNKCEVKFTTVYPFFVNTNMVTGNCGLMLKFRFPSITPFLDPSYVARQIVQGICNEIEYLYIPETFRIYLAGKFFLPTKLHRMVVDFFVEYSHYSTTYTRTDSFEVTTTFQSKMKIENVQNMINIVTSDVIPTKYINVQSRL